MDSSGISPSYRYTASSDQQFQHGEYAIIPTDIDEDKLSYDPENDQHLFPLVILMQTTTDQSKFLLPTSHLLYLS